MELYVPVPCPFKKGPPEKGHYKGYKQGYKLVRRLTSRALEAI